MSIRLYLYIPHSFKNTIVINIFFRTERFLLYLNKMPSTYCGRKVTSEFSKHLQVKAVSADCSSAPLERKNHCFIRHLATDLMTNKTPLGPNCGSNFPEKKEIDIFYYLHFPFVENIFFIYYIVILNLTSETAC